MKIYPTLPGLTYPVLKQAEFDTLVNSATNKYETRQPQTVNPQWSWQLVYDFLRDFPTPQFTVTELRTLLDFFLYHKGQATAFLYLDPDDNYVGPALNSDGTPNAPLAALQIVTDGAGNYYSPIQRTFGGLHYEDITDLNTDPDAEGSALAVYADGVLMLAVSDYALASSPGLAISGSSYMGLYLTWKPLATPAAPTLTAVAGSAPAATYYAKATCAATSGGETLPSAESSLAVGVATPAAPTLSAVAYAPLAARTAWTKITYTDATGETVGSAEATLALTAGQQLSVASPAASGDATGWNLYLSETASGAEQKQNATPIAIGTTWTEPVTGPVSGAAPPATATTTAVAAPDAPTLSAVAYAPLAARTGYAKITYTNSFGETAASTEANLALTAGQQLGVASPLTSGDATGWKLYLSETTSGAEQLQNSAPLAIGTAWTEPITGPVSGAVSPTATTALGALHVAAYDSPGNHRAAGWNLYVGTASGAETKQASVAYGAAWTEPNTGLIAGAAAPSIDSSALPASPVTAQFNFYFRARFQSDSQDMEKFSNQFWTIGGSESQKGSGQIKLIQARPNPL
jgi:hypothetical protein